MALLMAHNPMRRSCGYLLMEVLVSLAIVSVALGSFLGVYHSTRQQQKRLTQTARAQLTLQSVLDDVSAGRVDSAWLKADAWRPAGNDAVVWPAEPVAAAEHGAPDLRWQLRAANRPLPGMLFSFTAAVIWTDGAQTRAVSATTQRHVAEP